MSRILDKLVKGRERDIALLLAFIAGLIICTPVYMLDEKYEFSSAAKGRAARATERAHHPTLTPSPIPTPGCVSEYRVGDRIFNPNVSAFDISTDIYETLKYQPRYHRGFDLREYAEELGPEGIANEILRRNNLNVGIYEPLGSGIELCIPWHYLSPNDIFIVGDKVMRSILLTPTPGGHITMSSDTSKESNLPLILKKLGKDSDIEPSILTPTQTLFPTLTPTMTHPYTVELGQNFYKIADAVILSFEDQRISIFPKTDPEVRTRLVAEHLMRDNGFWYNGRLHEIPGSTSSRSLKVGEVIDLGLYGKFFPTPTPSPINY